MHFVKLIHKWSLENFLYRQTYYNGESLQEKEPDSVENKQRIIQGSNSFILFSHSLLYCCLLCWLVICTSTTAQTPLYRFFWTTTEPRAIYQMERILHALDLWNSIRKYGEVMFSLHTCTVHVAHFPFFLAFRLDSSEFTRNFASHRQPFTVDYFRQ